MSNTSQPPNGARGILLAAFSAPLRAVTSIIVIGGGLLLVWPFFEWAILKAVWSGSDPQQCVGQGACWIFIRDRMEQIVYGTYPPAERWRVDLCVVLAVALVALFRFMPKRVNIINAAGLSLIGYAIIAAVLLRGGLFGLTSVSTQAWGGLMLTAIIAAWTICTAVPLGLVLALSRRSRLPVISKLAGAFIDTVRSLPIVGLLFLAIVMFPFFVPPGVDVDKLMRALIAFTIFNAANLAEVFRGGLQSVPNGQREAGDALGLSSAQVTWNVVVPQAVYLSLPGMVNVCIAIVKETTIVMIVGLYDFLGVIQAGFSDTQWLAVQQLRATGYAFAALLFGLVCYALSRYSRQLEARLSPKSK